MKRRRSSFYHIFIFIVAQVASLSLLGIWIYWYVTNYIIFSQAGDKLSAEIISEGRNIFVLVSGLVLLIIVSVLMTLQFHRLNVHFNLSRMYDNFIANVTHELKSPLASIQLALETLQRHTLSKSRQDKFIQMMLKDTGRLNRLINAILEIPALEQKKIAHDFRIFTIGPLIRELIADARDQFNLSEEQLHIDGLGECRCVVDKNALKIVLDNLIDNSMKYRAESIRISIDMHCNRLYFVLNYQDQGVGIAISDQKKIFNKFFRIQNRTSPNVKGTGLGLYWTLEIVKSHGGRISVSSKGRNRGTTFRIELPIYKAAKNRHIRNLLKITQKQRREESDG